MDLGLVHQRLYPGATAVLQGCLGLVSEGSRPGIGMATRQVGADSGGVKVRFEESPVIFSFVKISCRGRCLT